MSVLNAIHEYDDLFPLIRIFCSLYMEFQHLINF